MSHQSLIEATWFRVLCDAATDNWFKLSQRQPEAKVLG
jgi:hypothetical protein